MQLKRLSLTKFRVFEQATFSFRPGINLLVGINGVGKSSVLDALRVLLSQAIPKFTASKSRPDSFDTDYITVGRDALTAELQFELGDLSFTQLMRQQSEKSIFLSKSGKGRYADRRMMQESAITSQSMRGIFQRTSRLLPSNRLLSTFLHVARCPS